jgi:hypothetical protein
VKEARMLLLFHQSSQFFRRFSYLCSIYLFHKGNFSSVYKYGRRIDEYERETFKLSKVERIVYNLKYFIEDHRVSFDETTGVLNSLERKRKWKLLPSDWDEIRFALLIDLRKVFKDVSQRERVAGQLVEEVIKPMVERS